MKRVLRRRLMIDDLFDKIQRERLRCKNCGELKLDVIFIRKYGDGQFLCPSCRGEEYEESRNR